MRLPSQPLTSVCQLLNALLLTCILKWLITVSVSGRPSGTDVSQTNYTLSDLSSANSNLSSLSQDAVILRRLHIGHTRLTHSYRTSD